MGQKIHPTGFRLAVSRNWASRWYANNNNFAAMLQEDIGVREYLKKKLKNASVGRVVIERPAKNARITIFSSRPGVVIGKKGEDIELLKMHRAGLCSIFSQLAREGRISVVDELTLEAPKTKLLAEKFKAMGLDSVLVITDTVDENLYLASRNLAHVAVVEPRYADPLSLIYFKKI